MTDFWNDWTSTNNEIDLGTCTGATTTGNITFPFTYTWPDDTNYVYQYHYYTDPKLLELMKSMIELMKEILKEKKKQRKRKK